MPITQAIICRAKLMSDAQTVKTTTSTASTQMVAAQVHTPVAIDLVARARSGEEQAWDALIERYASLIWSICRRSRLGPDHTEDVAQGVWLRLVRQLDNIRDPAALPGWLATTTRRECGRVLREARRTHATAHAADFETISGEESNAAEDDLMVAERHAALREAVAQLPRADRQLITLLMADPPLPYAEISARLGIPVGSIGPKRRRCLDKIRRYPSIAALISAAAEAA